MDMCCENCQKTNTPMWRAGPSGPKSLCNACGLRWKKGVLKLDVTGAERVVDVDSDSFTENTSMPRKEKKVMVVSGKLRSGKVAKKSSKDKRKRTGAVGVLTYAPVEATTKKMVIDLDRYECLFSGLMVVRKFKRVY